MKDAWYKDAWYAACMNARTAWTLPRPLHNGAATP